MFFDSSLYDPSAAWRGEPATDRQRDALQELGVRCHPSMTKGEAADLIGRHSDPHEEEVAFLRFFNVSGVAKFNQYEARREIAKIIAEPENRALRDNRPASDDQYRLIEFVEGAVPPGLTAPRAEALISSYEHDERLSELVEEFHHQEELREEREQELEFIYDDLSADSNAYGLRGLSRRDVRLAVEQLEAEAGQPLIELTDEDGFRERVADRIRHNAPDKAAPIRRPEPRVERKNKGSSIGAAIGLFLILSVLYNLFFG